MKTVDVWRTSLDSPAEELLTLQNLLSATESHRASRFRKETDRARYIVGRATLRLLISDYIAMPPELIPLHDLPGGKPALGANDSASHIHFNVSHCGGLALFAFSDQEVGIDVQLVEAMSDISGIVRNFFSSNEAAAFERLTGSKRQFFFFRTWVRKEAYLKATGAGLTIHPAKLQIGDLDGSEATLSDPSEETRIDQAFKVFDIAGMGNYVAAIAMASAICPAEIRLQEFAPIMHRLSTPAAFSGDQGDSSQAQCDSAIGLLAAEG